MNQNLLKNNLWQQLSGIMPKYYKTLGHLRFEQSPQTGARGGSLLFHKPGFEKITYEPLIDVRGKNSIKMGLVIRGIQVQSLKYIIHYYDAEGGVVKSVSQDVAPEISTVYKNICVTYAVPFDAATVKIEYHINGVAKGLHLIMPSVRVQ